MELNASVDPNDGALSGCGFEYGTTPGYGSALECAFTDASGECTFSASATGACEFPSDEGAVQVYARVFYPSPSTTYYFRITAADGDQAESATGTFTTPAALHFAGPDRPAKARAGPLTRRTTSKAHNAIGEVEAAIAAHLPPSGRNATIAALLKHGGFDSRVQGAPGGDRGDRLVLPAARREARRQGRRHKKRAPAPVLVASGKRTFYEAGQGIIKVRLTAAGKKPAQALQAHPADGQGRVHVARQGGVTATKTFELK